MRARFRYTLLATSLFVLVFLARHHLRVLGKVLRTYMTFYPYLAAHPESILRYNQSGTTRQLTNATSLHVPTIIHRVFLTEGRDVSFLKYNTATTSCQILHPNWTHMVWTDSKAADFISQHYPQLQAHYQGYRQTIQRANILRYALLHHYGGVYLDLDIDCLRPLDDLRMLSWLTPGAYPAGVNNAFMLSRPHHLFLEYLLQEATFSDLHWKLPYIENMLSTGCMLLSNTWISYMKSLRKSASNISERLFVLADENGNLEPHMLRGETTTPFFRHGGASSWHGWDAAAIVLIGEHYALFLVFLGLVGISAVIILQRLLFRACGKGGQWCSWRPHRAKLVRSGDEEARCR